ncbi:MAG: DNA ligase D [Gemmatimonadota bacterium]
MNSDGPTPDHLARYRAKRSADSSPEPVGTVSPVPGRLFVVHKHAARQLHYDLRLEMDGVLRSWAVPRGPSYDQADKRLAVRVEDHPLEYGDFEGVIPAGNYGAGGVIVWDRGEWVAIEDWREGLEKGKLLFELRGYKLKGRWTLVKIKKSEKDWLFIKERDSWLRSPGDVFPEESVLSGLTVEELQTGHSPAEAMRAMIRDLKPAAAPLDPRTVQAMNAEPRDGAFTSDEWIFELKLDGYRLLAGKRKGEAMLITRNGKDYTSIFPEVARAIKALPFEDIVIDGEVVVLGADGNPSFSLLQKRGSLSNEFDVRRAAVEIPTSFFAFDLLGFSSYDVRALPLVERKKLLEQALPPLGAVRFLDHIPALGEAMLAEVTGRGLEGIIAKKADSPYKPGRSAQWYKIKADRTADFVIVGYTAPKGGRGGFGALQLADYVRGALVYAGRAGTGFNERQLTEYREMLEELQRPSPPCLGPAGSPDAEPRATAAIPETSTTTWVEPRYVCEVRYREWTPEGLLRHPAFLRLRDDKDPQDCERQGWQLPGHEEAAPAGPQLAPQPEKKVTFSNLNKVFWPEEGHTKGQMIDYYRAIAPWLLPYLRNRPVVLTRYPDGIDGKSFYQKDAPEFAPEWLRTVPIWSNDTERFIRYFVCEDPESLLYLANSGTIPLHIWMSRVGSLEQPDWCVIDLDPKEATFDAVIETARVLHGICESISLPNYIKTTGKTGLHIMIPLGQQITYDQCRTLGELLSRLVIRELPAITTIARTIARRGDRVYLDYLQNRHGQLIVAPFSVRPLPGAPVSMPLVWDEVRDGLSPRDFTIVTAVERMKSLGSDPLLPVLESKPDLARILVSLSQLMEGQGS